MVLLINLCDRVPYLDPSFEALVKIQLRFCAEAYSRMAQVQQYVLPYSFFHSWTSLSSLL